MPQRRAAAATGRMARPTNRAAALSRRVTPRSAMSEPRHRLHAVETVIRPATADDLPALTEIYNHYVVNTGVTFDLAVFTPEQRRPWFDAHAGGGRHRLLVAVAADGTPLGYATTSRWRPKAAYDTTVEASIYCHPRA